MTSSLAPPPHHVARQDPKAPVTIGLAAIAGTVVLAIGDPNTTSVPLCPLKAATGIDCPFCGSLRAVHALTRLDLGAALSHNLLFTVAAPGLVVAWVVWLARSLGRPAPGRWQLPAATSTVLVVVAITFGVLRNLPGFAWLGSGA